jgi:hypothetical protein
MKRTCCHISSFFNRQFLFADARCNIQQKHTVPHKYTMHAQCSCTLALHLRCQGNSTFKHSIELHCKFLLAPSPLELGL